MLNVLQLQLLLMYHILQRKEETRDKFVRNQDSIRVHRDLDIPGSSIKAYVMFSFATREIIKNEISSTLLL